MNSRPQVPQPGRQPRLLDQVRDAVRRKHYSYRTEKTYLHWARRFIFFHGKRHPTDMAEPEVAAFLTHLAVDRRVSASTQNQALNAILFLYKQVRDGKGRKDRSVPLPKILIPALRARIEEVGRIRRSDLADGYGEISMPFALERKYPGAARELELLGITM